MALYLMPGFGAGAQYFNNSGTVLAGGKLYTYVTGSVNTALATYTDSTGNTANANPIILDSAGRLPAGVEIWCGLSVKFTLTDSNNNSIGSWDNVAGLNNVGVPTQLEYFLTGLTPTYISGTQITVPGNQIALFTTNRRVRYSQGAGVFYGYVTSSSFDGINTTTINITADSTVISNTVYQIDYAFLNSVNPSIPQQYLPQASVFIFGGTAGGTANALTLTPANPVSVYVAGQFFVFKAGASNNSGATTVAVSGLAAIAVQVNGQACAGNEIQAGKTYILALDTLTTCQLSELAVQHGAIAKTSLVDADEMPMMDSAASFLLKKITWANIKSTLVTYLSALTSTWAISTTGNATTATTATNQSGGTVAATTISASGVITSTVATGTPPFTISSTTVVANLSIGGNAATATSATSATSATTATNQSGGTINASTGKVGSLTTNYALVGPVTTYTVAATDSYLFLTSGGPTLTLTLPTPASNNGRVLYFKAVTGGGFNTVSASANVFPLGGGAAGTAILSSTTGSWCTLVCDGSGWIIMAGVGSA